MEKEQIYDHDADNFYNALKFTDVEQARLSHFIVKTVVEHGTPSMSIEKICDRIEDHSINTRMLVSFIFAMVHSLMTTGEYNEKIKMAGMIEAMKFAKESGDLSSFEFCDGCGDCEDDEDECENCGECDGGQTC